MKTNFAAETIGATDNHTGDVIASHIAGTNTIGIIQTWGFNINCRTDGSVAADEIMISGDGAFEAEGVATAAVLATLTELMLGSAILIDGATTRAGVGTFGCPGFIRCNF